MRNCLTNINRSKSGLCQGKGVWGGSLLSIRAVMVHIYMVLRMGKSLGWGSVVVGGLGFEGVCLSLSHSPYLDPEQ